MSRISSLAVRAGRVPGTSEVHIEGELPVGWAGSLAAGLRTRGVGIEALSGRLEGGSWDVTFHLAVEPTALALDLEALRAWFAYDPAPTTAPTLELESFRLKPTAAGTAEVTLESADRMGLLADALHVFAAHALFPIALDVRTERGRAIDWFELQSVGGQVSGRTLDALASGVGARPGPAAAH